MIVCEHFIYGLFKGLGYQLLKSKNISKQLSPENLNYLIHLGDGASQENYIQVYFPTEKILAVGYVNPLKDEYGRSGVWNHTILMKIDDYIQLTRPETIFGKYFIKSLKQIPESLEPIKID